MVSATRTAKRWGTLVCGTVLTVLLSLGGCGGGERTIEASLALPVTIGDSGPVSVEMIRIEILPLHPDRAPFGDPDKPILAAVNVPGRDLLAGAAGGGCDLGVCNVSLNLIIPAVRAMEVRAYVFLPDTNIPFFTRIFYGAGTVLLGEEQQPAAVDITVEDWASASAPEGTGYTPIGGFVELGQELGEACAPPSPPALPVPAEAAWIVAYDFETGVPLAIVNAHDTNFSGTQLLPDFGEWGMGFSGGFQLAAAGPKGVLLGGIPGLPAGRRVILQAIHAGDAFAENALEDFFSFFEGPFFQTPLGLEVGATGHLGPFIVPTSDKIDADISIVNCPARASLQVSFVEASGNQLTPLPVGSCSESGGARACTPGTLLAAANREGAGFRIGGCFDLSGNCGFFGYPDLFGESGLQIFFEHQLDPESTAVFDSFAYFRGEKAIPVMGLAHPSGGMFTRVGLGIFEVADPRDPGLLMGTDNSFSLPVSNEACTGLDCWVLVEHPELRPGANEVTVGIRRPAPPTGCAVDTVLGLLLFDHTNEDDTGAGTMSTLVQAVGQAGSSAVSLSCDPIVGGSLFNGNFWACPLGAGSSGGDYRISVRHEFGSIRGPSWASTPVTLSCTGVTSSIPTAAP